MIWTAAVTRDSAAALSGGEDGALIFWDLASGQKLRVLRGHEGPVYAVALFDDDRQAISASADKTLRIWDLGSGQGLAILRGHTAPVTGVGVSPDGGWAVSVSEDRTARAWDLTSGQQLTIFTPDSPFRTCTVSADDGLIITGDRGGQVGFLRLEGLGLENSY